MHPLQNGSQVTERPADKPVSGLPGYFTESGENNVPSYPGADWFNNVIDEFLNALLNAGVSYDSSSTQNLASTFSKYASLSGADFTGPISSVGLLSKSVYGEVIVGDNPIGIPGSDWPSQASLRDAINVSRKIFNNLTDCHGFADKTVIDNPSDYGGYGAFDATVILRGNHTQDHVASYQERPIFEGDGVLENSWGMIMWPVATGDLTVDSRIGAQIRGISTSTASVKSQIGVEVVPFNSLDQNVSFFSRNGYCQNAQPVSFLSEQDGSGYSYKSVGGGHFFQQSGKVGVGVDPLNTTFAFSSQEQGSSVVGSFSADSSNGAFVHSSGDNRVSFISNGSRVGFWGNSSESNAHCPSNDNSQPSGLPYLRWSVVYAGTGNINISDERKKSFLPLSEIEKQVANEIRSSCFRKYQLKDSLAIKGGDARIHYGVGAQSIMDVFLKHNLDPSNYALFCYDEWEDLYEEVQVNIGEKKIIPFESEVPVLVDSTRKEYVRDLVDGEIVLVEKELPCRVQKTIAIPLLKADGTSVLDGDGNPVFRHEPVFETVTLEREVDAEPVYEKVLVKEAGNVFGIRYDELFSFLLLYS